MLFFIPAWYQQDKWCENEQNWHARRMRTEFDDTVKQIQLFHRSGAYPFRILLLSFAPNFRHFLHRQSVYHAPYWSCFDAIQEIRRKQVTMFSFHNLNWPAHIEFVYTPFVVIAQLKGIKYAQIEFGEDGNPIQIDMYREGRIARRNIYDDRGFVSSTIVYENEKPVYQDYLTDKGVWKLRHFYSDGHVEVNSKNAEYLLMYGDFETRKSFSALSYDDMGQVIAEVFSAYVELTDKKDLFCVAMHELHAGILQKTLKDRKIILSFFEDRYVTDNKKQSVYLIYDADYIITDSQENIAKIQEGIENHIINIKDITPFDSRVDFGISQQLSVQKILVPVDGMDSLRFAELIGQLGEYLLNNENAQIHLFTRQADYGIKEKLLRRTRNCLRSAGLEEAWATENRTEKCAENTLEEEDRVPCRFYAEQCVDELSVSKCMREQRIVVDMRDTAEVYLRIAAISVGIPQIVYAETQFVEHGQNGYLVKDLHTIPDAIHHYLDSLTNWNEAMVYSYELGKNYTTEVLIEEWKEVISFVRSN